MVTLGNFTKVRNSEMNSDGQCGYFEFQNLKSKTNIFSANNAGNLPDFWFEFMIMTINSMLLYAYLWISQLVLVNSDVKWQPFECLSQHQLQIEKRPKFVVSNVDSEMYFFFEVSMPV